MKDEQMQPKKEGTAGQMEPKRRLSEYQMDRYMLGLSSPQERRLLEALLAADTQAREQFRQFREEWVQDQFQAGRDRLPSQAQEPEGPQLWSSAWLWRWGAGVAAVALVLVGGARLRIGWEELPSRRPDVTPPPVQKRTPHILRDRPPPVRRKTPEKRQPAQRKASARPPTVRGVLSRRAPLRRSPVRRQGAARRRRRRVPPMQRSGRLRPKGAAGPALVVALWRGDDVVRARSGQRFRRGDRLRLAYRWKIDGYVFLVHQEGNQIAPLYPRGLTARSLRIGTAGMQLLPGSLEVSGPSGGGETLWACFSMRPLSLKKVRRALASVSQKKDPSSQQPCAHLLRFLIRRE